MQMYPLAIATAKIRHRRYLPTVHHFESYLNYLWFDPEQISTWNKKSWLWSAQKWNVLSLNEDDFLTMQRGTIRQKIAHILLEQENFCLAKNAILRVLALPRTIGFRFNSVVFYWVFDAEQQLLFILSEITNTPWKERQVYVHDCRQQANILGSYSRYQFDFAKAFHVSPFMPMNLNYRWAFSFSDAKNVIHMQLYNQGVLQFDASMQFELQAITVPSQQHRYAVRNVFEPFRMLGGIYWQAFQLWKKKIPFYPHPKKQQGKS